MGVIQHHAVIATTWNDEKYLKVRQWVHDLGEEEQKLFSFSESWTNGYRTIFLAPDGSKEGWATSDKGDRLRERFIKKLDNHWKWVEISFGECGQSIVQGNNSNLY